MYLIQILVPRTDNDGKPFPRGEFDTLKEELLREFQGVTAYTRAPAEGLWNEGGAAGSDDIVIFEVMAQAIDLAAWRDRRAALERPFRQERMIIRYQSISLV